MNNPLHIPLYVGIILQRNNEIFLIQRANTNWMSGYWNFPGGLVEKNETIRQAACREATEEIGVAILPQDFMVAHVLHVHKNETNIQDIIGIYFKTQKWSGQAANNELEKIIAAQWFDINNLPSNITEHALLAIDGLKREYYYSEHGW